MIRLAETAQIKSFCCFAWQHPAVRLLLGDHLHPGGRAVTVETISSTRAIPGDVVLDVGCGHGASLRLMAARGIRSVGVDLSEDAIREAARAGAALVGDGEKLPLSDGSVDAAIMECVVSLLPDKRRALAELRRVVKPRGRVIVTDMVTEAPLPLPLQGVAAWSSCISGALSLDAYKDLLSASGFHLVSTNDRSGELTTTLEQVGRRLSLLEIAVRLGAVQLDALGVPADIFDRARDVVTQLVEEVRKGSLGYSSLIAESPPEEDRCA